MINVSDAFEVKIESGFPVTEEVQITFANGVVKTVRDEILNADNEIADGIDGNSFPIGTTVCKTCGLALDNSSEQWKDYDFFGAKLKVRLKMTLDDGTVETVNKGTYTVTVPEEYGEDVELTALDDMYKANKTYTTNLQFPQTAFSVLRDACQTCGISLGVTNMVHGDVQISAIPQGVTFRVVIGCIAMLESANARIDTDGYLQFIKWDFSITEDTSDEATVSPEGFVDFGDGSSIDSDGYVVPAGNWVIDPDGYLYLQGKKSEAVKAELREYISSPTLSTDDIVITGIRVKSGDTSYLYGANGYVVELENNLLQSDQVQTVASWIGDNLIGIRFRSMEGDLLYNPLIEFGDMARTYDRKGNSYITPITYAASPLNGKTTLKTQAESPIRGTSKYYSESTKTVAEARKLVQQEKSARDKALKDLKEGLTDGSGMYETSVQQEDGSIISYIHDKPTIEKSKIVIKLTSNAIGVSNDGGQTYPCGFIFNGTLITKILAAEGINADYIDTGVLTVKDEKGNIIFQADIDNKTVRISSDCVMIGDRALTKTLEDMENTIAEGKNMSVLLSNEYQGIPADSNGNVIGSFPEVKTTVSTFYGTTDISNDCSYSVQKSDTVTGNWKPEDHTYTVTALTGDSGWIDIRVIYLQTMSVTKRFNIAKVRGGKPSRTYILEPSCNIIKRNADKVLSPNFIEYKAYYVEGDAAKRVPYKGRMVIEQTADGNKWTTLYTSSTDENTVKRYLSGTAQSITNIRCRLYAAGGTTDMLDMQSTAIVLDVDSLTAEQIVNILTDKGKWKGLYYLNGHLYFSFDAALGGVLTLGGEHNGDGRMMMRRSDGTPYGSVDNDGITFFQSYTEGSTEYEYEGYRLTKDGVKKVKGSKSTDSSPDIVMEDELVIDFDKIRKYSGQILLQTSIVTLSIPSFKAPTTKQVSQTFTKLSDANECVAIFQGVTGVGGMINCCNYSISENKLSAVFANLSDEAQSGTAVFQILQYGYIGEEY
ncbi:MAG: hypothetical protein Q4Q33_03930 [Eubacteriales bacterium]|nr:hypothetical protein [Eubacteriales bacterium]